MAVSGHFDEVLEMFLISREDKSKGPGGKAYYARMRIVQMREALPGPSVAIFRQRHVLRTGLERRWVVEGENDERLTNVITVLNGLDLVHWNSNAIL